MHNVVYKWYQLKRGKMIICIGTSKGGTGKTTLATNLAGFLVKNKEDVLLIDTDRQGSASTWCALRDQDNNVKRVPCMQKFGANIDKEIIELSKRFKYILVDVGGFDSEELRTSILVCDILFIPLKPSQFDIWTLSAMSKLVSFTKMVNPNMKAFIVLNMVSTNPNINEFEDVVKSLEVIDNIEVIKNPIHERITFRKAAQSGLSIFELDKTDKKAIDELMILYGKVINNDKK